MDEEMELKMQPVEKKEEPTEKKNINFQEINKLYSQKQLEYWAFENNLIGNFENGEYKFLDIYKTELTNLDKIIELKDDKKYVANSTINGVKLTFVVDLTNQPDGQILATLKLVEKFAIAKIFSSAIETEIKSMQGPNTPDFLFQVRKAFHLRAKNENTGIVSFAEYTAPPIEVLTAILFKGQQFETIKANREKLDNKYVSDILKTLKTNEEGKVVIKEFVDIIKKNKFEELKENKTKVYRELIDKLVDENVKKGKISKNLVEKIIESKNTYLEELAPVIKSNKEKVANGEDLIPSPKLEPIPPKPAEPAKTQEKPAPSSSSSGSGSSGSGGGSSGGGGGSSGGKEDKKPAPAPKPQTNPKPAQTPITNQKPAQTQKPNQQKPVQNAQQPKTNRQTAKPQQKPIVNQQKVETQNPTKTRSYSEMKSFSNNIISILTTEQTQEKTLQNEKMTPISAELLQQKEKVEGKVILNQKEILPDKIITEQHTIIKQGETTIERHIIKEEMLPNKSPTITAEPKLTLTPEQILGTNAKFEDKKTLFSPEMEK